MILTDNRKDRNLRPRFLTVDGETCRELREFWPLVAEQMTEIISGFCTRLSMVPELATLVGSNIPRLKKGLSHHWEALFSGRFDDEYFEQARQIGRIHHRIGLELQWYVGGYSFVLDRLVAIAFQQADWPRSKIQSVTTAIGRAVMLDTELAISSYLETEAEQERFQQEANIAKAAREQTSRLLSGLPAAVYSGTLGPDARFLSFQMRGNAEQVSGRPASEFASWLNWAEMAAGIDEAAWQQYFDNIVKHGEAVIEYDFRHESGALIRCRDQARVIERRENDEAEIVGYISDITRDHEIRAQALASAKLATLGEMATDLAHEMNQPITIMSLAAENSARMLETKGEEGIAYSLDRLRRIKDQALRARTIIDHLKIFGGQAQESNVAFRLADAIAGALSLVGGSLRSAGIIVINRVSDKLPPIYGGLVLAEHVIVNLMLNARDAMARNAPSASREIVLHSTTDEAAGTVSLHIRDTGPGIPGAVRERLFEPFFTTKEVGKGTGLGLSISHGIMTSFAGSITADNTPESGAIFTLTFCEAPGVT